MSSSTIVCVVGDVILQMRHLAHLCGVLCFLDSVLLSLDVGTVIASLPLDIYDC